MKKISGFSFAAGLCAALLLSTALPTSAGAASLGGVVALANEAQPIAQNVQARVGRGGRGGARVGGRVGRGGGFARSGRGYYRRGGNGAGIAAGIAGAAILGAIISQSQRDAYYDDGYSYGEPVYDGPVYVAPRREYRRRYTRNRNVIPYNPVRDPAGGGLTTGGY